MRFLFVTFVFLLPWLGVPVESNSVQLIDAARICATSTLVVDPSRQFGISLGGRKRNVRRPVFLLIGH